MWSQARERRIGEWRRRPALMFNGYGSALRTRGGGSGRGRTSHRGMVKGVVWVLCLLPLALLGWDAFTDGLGAEPIENITHRTGWGG